MLVAGATAVAAQIPAALLAAGLCAGGRTTAVTRWFALLVLLTPPYVYAYAWSLPLLPGGVASFALTQHTWLAALGTYVRAIVCLACWSAPLSAFLLAAAWKRAGRPAYRLALLDSPAHAALLRAGLPAMRLWIGLSTSVIAALALTEYSVPHLCLVQTWNTEVLAEIQSAGPNGRALLLGWPLLVLVLLIALAWWPLRQRIAPLLLDMGRYEDLETDLGGKAVGRSGVARLATAAAVVLLLSPFIVLLSWLQSPARIIQIPATTRQVWLGALSWAVVAGVFALLIAVPVVAGFSERTANRPAVALGRMARGLLIAVALFFAIAPPALVGDAFVAAYLRLPWIYNHGVIISLVGAARFAFIPLLVVWLASRTRDLGTDEMARTDRADRAQRFWHVAVPQCMRPALCAALMVSLLTLGEVAAVQLVQPAGVGSVAMTLLNQIHFGRNDEIIAMCLHVGAVVGVVSWLALLVTRTATKSGRKAI